MNELRKRMSEPQFTSVLFATQSLAMTLGILIVSLRVKAGAAHIYNSTGVVFWPQEGGTRFSWNMMFGSPWISLASGCAAGTIAGLVERRDLVHQKESWIRDCVLRAKGEKPRSGRRDIARVIALLAFIPTPAVAMAFYFPFSALIFAHAASFVHTTLLYPQLRTYRHEVNDILRTTQLNDDEQRNVDQSRTRERKTLKSSYRWVAGFSLVILIAASYFAYHVDQTVYEAERSILERQHGQPPK